MTKSIRTGNTLHKAWPLSRITWGLLKTGMPELHANNLSKVGSWQGEVHKKLSWNSRSESLDCRAKDQVVRTGERGGVSLPLQAEAMGKTRLKGRSLQSRLLDDHLGR